jgi:putative hydrolase of the HAD superfamily
LPSPVAIFFDAVGTLIFPNPSVGEVYSRIGRRHGAVLEISEIDRRFSAAFRRQEAWDAEHGNRTSEDRERQRWQSIVAEVFHDLPNSLAPFAELWKHFASAVAWTCYSDVAPCLAWLDAAGLAWGIASNYDSRLRTVVTGLPVLSSCRYLAISSEIGWRKPAPEFFAVLPTLAGLPREQVILVGDDEETDWCGGRAAGLSSVWLKRNGGAKSEHGIGSLADLPRWLSEHGRENNRA